MDTNNTSGKRKREQEEGSNSFVLPPSQKLRRSASTGDLLRVACDNALYDTFAALLDDIWVAECWNRIAINLGKKVGNSQITGEQCKEQAKLLRKNNKRLQNKNMDYLLKVPNLWSGKIFKKKLVPRFPAKEPHSGSGSRGSLKRSSFRGEFSQGISSPMCNEGLVQRATSEILKLSVEGLIDKDYTYKVAALYSKMIQDGFILNVELFCSMARNDSIDKAALLERIASDMKQYEKP